MTRRVDGLSSHELAPAIGAGALAGLLGSGQLVALLVALLVVLLVLGRHLRPRAPRRLILERDRVRSFLRD